MNLKKELLIAYCLAVIFLIVGVISYAAFPAKTPDQPVRLMFKGVAGKVLFDHKTHTADFECSDCHHLFEVGKKVPELCGDCHDPEIGNEYITGDVLFDHQIHKTDSGCLDCHEPIKEGKDPKSCAACHKPEMKDGYTSRTDAFHNQCIGCHEENDSGPGKKDCSLCHVM